MFNGLRYVVKTGAPWRWMPNDLPSWAAVYQLAQHWLAACCFEALAECAPEHGTSQVHRAGERRPDPALPTRTDRRRICLALTNEDAEIVVEGAAFFQDVKRCAGLSAVEGLVDIQPSGGDAGGATARLRRSAGAPAGGRHRSTTLWLW